MQRVIWFAVVLATSVAHADAKEREPEPEPAPIQQPVPEPIVESAAEIYPTAYVERPLVLPPKLFAAQLVTRVSLTANKVTSPIHIGPSAFYGVMPKLQVGIIHPQGLCLFGTYELLGTEVDECDDGIYNDVGLDGMYTLPVTKLPLAAHAVLFANQFNPDFELVLRLGVIGKYVLAKRFAVVFDPALRFGLSNRAKGNKEAFDLYVQLAVQATGKLHVFLETGILAPFAEMTDTYQIPLGFGGQYTLRDNIDVGLRFTFPVIAGGKALGSIPTADTRQLDLFFVYRR